MYNLLVSFLVAISVSFIPSDVFAWKLSNNGTYFTETLVDRKSKEKIRIAAYPRENYKPAHPKSWFTDRFTKSITNKQNIFESFDIAEANEGEVITLMSMHGYYDENNNKRLLNYFVVFYQDSDAAFYFEFEMVYDMDFLARVLGDIISLMVSFSKGIGNWEIHYKEGHAIYNPRNLHDNERFRLIQYRPVELGRYSLANWFNNEVEHIVKETPNIYQQSKAIEYNTFDGVDYTWYVTNIDYKSHENIDMRRSIHGYTTPDNRATLMVYEFSNNGTYKRYKSTAQSVARSTAYYQEINRLKIEQQKAEEELKRKEQAQEKLRQARWTKPNKGVQMQDIEAITYYMDIDVDGYGSARPIYYIYLLLKNNTAYKNPTIPPSDFNITASREYEPGKWFTWRINESRYEIKADGSDEWRTILGSVVSPGKAGVEHIDSHLSYLESWGNVFYGGGSKRSTITLHKNGRFTTTASSLFSTGSGMANIASANVYSESDEKGTTSGYGASGPAGAIAHNRKKRSGNPNRQGEYTIDGYTIELRYDNGSVKRKIFFYSSENYIYIDGIDYKING